MQFLKSHLKTRNFHFYCQALGEGTVTMSVNVKVWTRTWSGKALPRAWLAIHLNSWTYTYIYDSWKIQMLQNKLNFKENNNKSIVFDDGDDTT